MLTCESIANNMTSWLTYFSVWVELDSKRSSSSTSSWRSPFTLAGMTVGLSALLLTECQSAHCCLKLALMSGGKNLACLALKLALMSGGKNLACLAV